MQLLWTEQDKISFEEPFLKFQDFYFQYLFPLYGIDIFILLLSLSLSANKVNNRNNAGWLPGFNGQQ